MEQRLSSPNDTGLFSSIALGQIWFPSLETELQQSWNICWKSLQKTYFKKVPIVRSSNFAGLYMCSHRCKSCCVILAGSLCKMMG